MLLSVLNKYLKLIRSISNQTSHKTCFSPKNIKNNIQKSHVSQKNRIVRISALIEEKSTRNSFLTREFNFLTGSFPSWRQVPWITFPLNYFNRSSGFVSVLTLLDQLISESSLLLLVQLRD